MTPAEEDGFVRMAIAGATSRSEVDTVEALRLAIRAAVAQERERAVGAFTLDGGGPDATDATRYRYLRNVAGQTDEDWDGVMICAGLGDDFDFLRGEECDKAVDDAIAQFGSAAAIRRET